MEKKTLELTPLEVEALWWIASNWESEEEWQEWFKSINRPDLAIAGFHALRALDEAMFAAVGSNAIGRLQEWRVSISKLLLLRMTPSQRKEAGLDAGAEDVEKGKSSEGTKHGAGEIPSTDSLPKQKRAANDS
jgi:hypothetical protein